MNLEISLIFVNGMWSEMIPTSKIMDYMIGLIRILDSIPSGVCESKLYLQFLKKKVLINAISVTFKDRSFILKLIMPIYMLILLVEK